MYDTIGTGKLRSDEVVKLLSSINRTASYFGDPCLTEQQVIDLVEDVFNSEEGKIKDFLYQVNKMHLLDISLSYIYVAFHFSDYFVFLNFVSFERNYTSSPTVYQ
jgi:hypothetical protein